MVILGLCLLWLRASISRVIPPSMHSQSFVLNIPRWSVLTTHITSLCQWQLDSSWLFACIYSREDKSRKEALSCGKRLPVKPPEFDAQIWRADLKPPALASGLKRSVVHWPQRLYFDVLDVCGNSRGTPAVSVCTSWRCFWSVSARR